MLGMTGRVGGQSRFALHICYCEEISHRLKGIYGSFYWLTERRHMTALNALVFIRCKIKQTNVLS